MSAELEQRIAEKGIEPETARELRDFERFLTIAGPPPKDGEKRKIPAEWKPYIDGTGPAPPDIDRLREQIADRLMGLHGEDENATTTNRATARAAADRVLSEIGAQGYEIVGKRPD